MESFSILRRFINVRKYFRCSRREKFMKIYPVNPLFTVFYRLGQSG
ncbi:hypothetical protein Runsl_4403 [Runella slithyformis DSM 19594]|uniref:Uncharacterized protein n=1 Tax=Runella slithyformis (strain ATCC 29530 / DSM 19594 / LMG 11500 / NCIMB 11436 / LSU 4) TaxID=761193 RepID=A0A7U3ZP15_RUNSL|nr:hypothetical protein Runsl_4403 [Runella slithyformis DSM 19594]